MLLLLVVYVLCSGFLATHWCYGVALCSSAYCVNVVVVCYVLDAVGVLLYYGVSRLLLVCYWKCVR